MKNKIVLSLTLLEFKTGTFEGREYASIVAKYNGRVLRFKVDKAKAGDLSEYADKEVNVVVDVVAGNNLAATMKVVGIEE